MVNLKVFREEVAEGSHLHLPDSEHVEVPLGQREALVVGAREAEAEGEHGEREGQEAGDDKQQSPQGEPAERGRESKQRWSRSRINNTTTPTLKYYHYYIQLSINSSLRLKTAEKTAEKTAYTYSCFIYSRPWEHISPTIKPLLWLPVHSLIQYKAFLLLFKSFHGQASVWTPKVVQSPTLAGRAALCVRWRCVTC